MRFLNAIALRRAASRVALVVWATACHGNGNTATSPSCSFALSPSSASHAVSGGTGTVRVTTLANCSWTATSDVEWVLVTGGSSGQGSGTVTYRVAPNTTGTVRSSAIKVVDANGRSSPGLHEITQQATTEWLRMTGPYTFGMEVDPTCGWPISSFRWDVFIEVASYAQGTTSGWITFPPTPEVPSNNWYIYATPMHTQLTPAQGGPGPAAAATEVVIEGGRWEAGGPTRAPYNRGEIKSGTAAGARQILLVRSSGKRWECRSDVKWTLLVRYVDID